MTPPSVGGCPILILVLTAASALAAGCDEEERAASGAPDPDHVRELARNPYALTCGDLRKQSHPEGARVVIRAQTALVRERALRRRVAEQGPQRVNQSIYFALTEVCKGRDPSFRPARQTVEGVRRGSYQAELCIGPACSDEVRWLAARLVRGGRIARVVTAHSSNATPAELRVRMGETEVGLTLRLLVRHPRSDDVRLHCAEVELGRPAVSRTIVDDGSGPFNPLGASVDFAERRLARGKRRCIRVPSSAGPSEWARLARGLPHRR
jgi:hypothetical protein